MHGLPNAGDLCQEMDKIMYQRLMVIKVKHTGCVVTLYFVVGIQNRSLFSSAHISLVFSDAIACAFTFLNACALRRTVRGRGGPNFDPDQIFRDRPYMESY